MKKQILFLAIMVFAISGMAAAGLWDPAISDPSFESIEGGADHGSVNDWGYQLDEWFEDENGGSATVFWEKGGAIGLAGDAEIWAGTETGGALYQAIGTVDNGVICEVTALIGARDGNFGTASFNLFAGGTEDDGADAVLIESFATQLDSVEVTLADGTEVGTNVYQVTLELSTGTGHGGEILWLQVKSINGKDYFDNISIVGPDLFAKLPDPENGEVKVDADQAVLSWVAPQDYVPTGYDVYRGTDANELSPDYLGNFKVVDNADTLSYGPVDLEYNTTYFWSVDAYEPNDGGSILHAGNLWSFTTANHPSQFPGISVVNGSFESVSDPGNDWGYAADDWFEGGASPFWEIGSTIDMPNCDGILWAGMGAGDSYYQIIGDVAGQVLDVQLITGFRPDWGEEQIDHRTEVSLYAGGTIADAADGIYLDTFATKIDSVEYALSDLEAISLNEFTLNTQLFSGGTIGETLWIQVKAVAGRTYFDNIIVEAVNPLSTNSAWGPNVGPLDEDGLVSTTECLLSWQTGVVADVDNNYETDGDIVAHHIYLSRDRDAVTNSDVSAYRGSQMAADTDFAPAGQGEDLVSDSTYYWMIVEELSNGTKLAGMCWSFETEKLLAVITEQPVDTVIDPGTDAELSVLVDSATAESYSWLQITETGDVEVGTGSTLTTGDAGDYYCIITNNAGEVTTDVAHVTIKQLMGYWSFDGNLVSSVDAAHVGTVDTDRYTSDSVIGQAWEFLADPNVIVIENSVEDFNFYPRGYTLSAWVKTTQTGGWGAYVAKQDKTGDDRGIILTHNGGGSAVSTLRESFSDLSSGNVGLNNGEWHHVAGTYNAQTGLGKIFVDGVLENTSGENFSALTLHEEPLFFGAETPEGAVAFVGLLDEVKIWNYALDGFEVAGEYTGIRTDVTICVEIDQFDFNEDCVVDLADFAAFAASWMDCNLVPCIR